ncbi:unnamed protein product [Fusarium venenatum]|uniref:DUF676 domain-containing protein n=1 Tax=Fusarium venenatum TaxID=56646 RepID=A0A2L2TJK4_9HYPO|nr:uncharacterized protein FVRRES_07672 [Fusarium venenatum]KAH6994570.1 hypothetical protein EDB82DRAFT_537441 [Fusarium venenatum]CEI63236.1 unnamed protein product [Fusarium venenatum]
MPGSFSKVVRGGKEDKNAFKVETTTTNNASIITVDARGDRNSDKATADLAEALSPVTGGQEPAQASVSNTSLSSVETVEDEADCWGLFTFIEKGRDESGIVDIVAIHGLNGHYYKTWSTSSTKGSRINWLKDMLPERIPNARIMSFGYNTNVQFSKSTAGISDFVEGLLSDLMSCRTSHQEKTRPIIFICHSLGGIVFKQALVRARERDRYTDLLKHIPDFGKVLASILKASTMGINTNTKVVNDLKKNSQALYEITQSFVDRSKALHIVTFYETEKMEFLSAQIMVKESAVLNLPNEIPVLINGNHSSMCKFSNSGAAKRSFTRVYSHLEEMISGLIKNEVSYPASK